jgi:UDP-N-acetylglucosamine 4,6-dehydratase/5-epimerase
MINWCETSVLITGGTGSFGRKCLAILMNEKKPKRIIIFSRDELKQHEIRLAYPETADSPIRFFIGDVRDLDRLKRAFHGVDVVVHAAALKQVPACEYNPFEAIKTNILGAKNVIDAAIDHNVKFVVAVSTDKAVNPTNLYGATKLCAEKLFIQGNSYSGSSGTQFCCVRYGNVVGSRGSVMPLFLAQRNGGRITITDRRMTRFWLDLGDGVRAVLSAAEQMRGGEVFVPKIPSMNIMDLTTAIAPGCAIDEIGIRPGEKLHEVLVSEDEARSAVELEDAYVIMPNHSFWHGGHIQGGRHLPNGFRYSSDTNEQWLSTEDLRRMADNWLSGEV